MYLSKKILIIRLGALGDFIQSFFAFAAIRQHHTSDHITLLTTKPFVELGHHSPWFDRVLIDERSHFFNLIGNLKLAQNLSGYDFVYDLQTSKRSTRYFKLAGKPKWSGIARNASHQHSNPKRNEMHTIDRQRDQLRQTGITRFPAPEVNWLIRQFPGIKDLKRYAVLVPGCSKKRPEKRWPIESYAEIANLCIHNNITPVVVGGYEERSLVAVLQSKCPEVVNLVGKTSIFNLAAVFADALFALGNDTGPMHIAAIVGCPSIVLFSSSSDPLLTAPRGKNVKIITQPILKDLTVKRVARELKWVH